MKKLLPLSILSFTCLLLILLFGFDYINTKRVKEIKKEKPLIQEEAVEVKEEKTNEMIFQETFGTDLPEPYQKRLKVISISTAQKPSRFAGSLIIFPYPLFLVETLNISLWTETLFSETIKEVNGMIYFGENKTEKIQFFPTKTLKENEIIKKLWLGTKEFTSIAPVGNYSVVIQAHNQSNIPVDEIQFVLEITDSAQVSH